MKKFFIVTDIDGNIVSGEVEFATELEANDWAKENKEKGQRLFVEVVIETV